jgi:hypothetical protein
MSKNTMRATPMLGHPIFWTFNPGRKEIAAIRGCLYVETQNIRRRSKKITAGGRSECCLVTGTWRTCDLAKSNDGSPFNGEVLFLLLEEEQQKAAGEWPTDGDNSFISKHRESSQWRSVSEQTEPPHCDLKYTQPF